MVEFNSCGRYIQNYYTPRYIRLAAQKEERL